MAVLGGSIYMFDAVVLMGRTPVSMGVDAAVGLKKRLLPKSVIGMEKVGQGFAT